MKINPDDSVSPIIQNCGYSVPVNGIDHGSFNSHVVSSPVYISNGLTKREFFAAMSMMGLRSSRLRDIDDLNIWSPNKIATQALYDADALIDELNIGEK